MTSRAVFLDRDGTLNRPSWQGGRPFPPIRLEDFELLPGVVAAAQALHAAGFKLIVATNQPDVATGKQSRTIIEAMHARLRAWLPLADIEACFCVEGEDCECYKPKPGMLQAAAYRHSIDLRASFMVGDRWRDVGAGHAAGCRTILIGDGYGEPMPVAPDHVVASLADAVPIILSTPSPETAQ